MKIAYKGHSRYVQTCFFWFEFTSGTSLRMTENRLSFPFFAIHVRSLPDSAVSADAKATASGRAPS